MWFELKSTGLEKKKARVMKRDDRVDHSLFVSFSLSF